MNSFLIKKVHAKSGPKCVQQCLKNDCCRSVNFYTRCSSQNEDNCELLHGVATEHPEQLTLDKDFDHYNLLNTNRVSVFLAGNCVINCFYSPIYTRGRESLQLFSTVSIKVRLLLASCCLVLSVLVSRLFTLFLVTLQLLPRFSWAFLFIVAGRKICRTREHKSGLMFLAKPIYVTAHGKTYVNDLSLKRKKLTND